MGATNWRSPKTHHALRQELGDSIFAQRDLQLVLLILVLLDLLGLSQHALHGGYELVPSVTLGQRLVREVALVVVVELYHKSQIK